MKLLRVIGLIVLLFSWHIESVSPSRPWLVFVYMCADNTLWQDADPNIAQMVKASNTPNAYIVVYLNIKRSGQQKESQLLLIQDGKIIPHGPTGAEDGGDYKTLIKALSTAITDFPADHIMVDLWDHGSGPLNRHMTEHRGVCYDDSTGHFMTDRDYKQAFDTIVNQHRGGKKIDIIAFDACLMADLEVNYTLQPYANFAVSSQQTVPGPGYNYTTALQPLATANLTPASFAVSLVKAYDAYYKSSGQGYTLSAIDLSKLGSVVNTTNTLATQLTTLLNNDTSGSVAQAIYNAATSSNLPQFDEPTYLDLYTLCSNLYEQASQAGLNNTNAAKLKLLTRSCMSTLSQAVMINAHSSDMANAKGMSIYFADINSGMEPSYTKLYWSEKNPAWMNFLNTYLNA